MKHSLWLCILVGVCLSGCTPNVSNRGEPPKTSAGVEEALPTNIAGPPQTLIIPHQSLPPVIMAVAYGGVVRMYSGSRWHGKVVSLYYTPATNILHKGDHYELQSAKGIQYLTKTNVQADGTWRVEWNHGQYGIPKHRPFFIMARDDRGEIGIVHVNTHN